MIENLAVVTDRQGRCVRLRTASPTGCARCDAGEGCGGGVFGKLVARRLQGLSLDDPDLDLQPGQHVVLGIDDKVFLRATAGIYLLPLASLLVAALLARIIGFSEPAMALAGVTGLLAGLWLAPRLQRRHIDRHLLPKVLRRASSEDLKVCQS